MEVEFVLRIGSAHNNGRPSDLKHCRNCAFFGLFLNWNSGLYSFTSTQQTRTVLDFQLVSYFTNFAVQNVNKVFVYITDLTSTLNLIYSFFILKIILKKLYILTTWVQNEYIWPTQLPPKYLSPIQIDENNLMAHPYSLRPTLHGSYTLWPVPR